MAPRPSIVFQPDLARAFQRGINQMADTIRPTLGPLSRHVAIARMLSGQAPEVLDSAGVIARRVIELPGRAENAGAMLIRHSLWQLHETVGDGTATAAVIFQTVYNEGVKYIAAGGDPMLLRGHLEQGVKQITQMLDEKTLPISDRHTLTQLALSISHDDALAQVLGEIFDIIGPFGQLDIRRGQIPGLDVNYIDGSQWKSGVSSPAMIREKFLGKRHICNAAILISDLELEDPHDLVPLMRLAVREGIDGLIIVANKLSDTLVQLIIANEKPGRFDIVAVRPPGTVISERPDNLNDLAALVGGRPLVQAAGDSLRDVQAEDLGFARRVWADADHFGVTGGTGDVFLRRERIERLKNQYQKTDDLQERTRLQKRIGGLMGGSAMLLVGSHSRIEAEMLQSSATRTAAALRVALNSGLLPGGGVALLACRDRLRQTAGDTADADKRAAYHILQRALEAPFWAITSNAGFDPALALAHVQDTNRGRGFDVMTGRAVDMVEAGIVDSAAVIRAAVQTAISGAALALTTDALVQQRNPPQAVDP